MNKDLIRKGLNGRLNWYDPTGEMSEEDFRKQIQESIARADGKVACLQPIEEMSELMEIMCRFIKDASKIERVANYQAFDPDVWLELHEEIGDVLWGIGYLIERYNLSEDLVKDIHRFKMEVNRRRDKGLPVD